MCAQASSDALREITKASFGNKPRAWAAWWAANRSRRRLEWLVAGLRSSDVDIRLGSIEELSRAFSDNLGYYVDAKPAELEAAARRWTALARNVRSGFDL